MAAATPIRPHDLLWLKRVPRWHDAPEWVAGVLAQMPVVVVRRAGAPKGLVSVGVRGAQRNQRYGALLSIADIEACLSPEMLVAPQAGIAPAPGGPRPLPALAAGRAGLPALAVLQGLPVLLRRFRLVWGPTGSVGFELATGVPAVRPSSDLDVLIRQPEWMPRETAQSLLGTLASHAAEACVRIDAQLETPAGAVSLAEYAGGARRVLLRSGGEPVLVEDPWALGVAPAAERGVKPAAGAGSQPSVGPVPARGSAERAEADA